MATFNLPTTKHAAAKDPNILPKREGFDYTARADESWRSIADHLLTIADTEQVYQRTASRVVAGEDWLQGNRNHANYLKGYQQVSELRNDLRNLAINLNSLRRVVWNECCTLYACMNHSEWRIDRRNAETARVMSPEEIWESVMPGRDAPGSWPPSEKDHYIERKVTYVSWDSR